MYYIIKPTNQDMLHYGVSVKDGSPGRGSGRYPLGSGKKIHTITDRIHRNAVKKEPSITKDIVKLASDSGAKMYGLEHRLKTKDSIERKIKTDAVEKKIPIQESAKSLKDTVRYTVLSDDNNFVKSYNTVKNGLEKIGYKEIRCRNYFDEYRKGNVKHKSVQSVFKDQSGFPFEVQFQTPSSQDAKNKKIPIYEERRKLGVSNERALFLEKQMDILAQNVKDPDRVFTIKSHG